MNFLSSALSSLTGLSIPYSFKEKIVEPLSVDPSSRSIWTVYNGTNPKTDTPVSIFEFNLKDPALAQYEPLARNSFRKLKLVRLPHIVAALDFFDSDLYLYIVTEQVVPLTRYLADERVTADAKLYGIHSIIQAILLVNTKAHCVHACLNSLAVFVSAQGEWKLFGFELLTNLDSDPDQPVYRLSARQPHFSSGLPAEAINGIEGIRPAPTKLDSFRLGIFILWVLVGEIAQDESSIDTSQVASHKIPRPLVALLKRLLNAKPSLRTLVERFSQETASFFANSPLVALSALLDELKFQSDAEKLAFFKNGMAPYVEAEFPPGYLDKKLLPEIVSQFNLLLKAKPTVNSTPEQHQQRQESISLLLNHILKLSTNLADEPFGSMVKPIIFQCFALPDRSIRLTLLHHLPSYCSRLSDYEVQSKIFYNLVTGFQDTNFMIRETTLTLITTIIDKVSVKQVNQDLLKILAKLQMDPKPSIRTNTLILIIKISSKIYANSRNSVVITALSKSLRDSFTPCKLTALQGFEKLVDDFSLDEICGKILGHLAIALMDGKSAKVREEAKRVFQLYFGYVEKHAATLPRVEEDEDEEEREFFKKFAPVEVKEKTNSEAAASPAEGGALSFGWSMVNKFVTSSEVQGNIDESFNRSTPDLTRISTPTTQETQKLDTDNWNDELDDNDGWGDDDFDNEPEILAPPPKPSVLARAAKPSRPLGNATTKKTLKLSTKKVNKAPGSTLKLNLQDNDNDDDGWGGEW